MPTSGLYELFARELRFLYSAHQQGAKQADANISTSTHPKLKRMLQRGVQMNKKQGKRLEKVFESAKLVPSPRHDRAMAGVAEANTAMTAETSNPTERDLINIGQAQIASHVYLAKYGTARAYARRLGLSKAAALLSKTLDETGQVDTRFTSLAREIVRSAGRPSSTAKEKSGSAGPTLTALLIAGLVASGLHSVQQRRSALP